MADDTLSTELESATVQENTANIPTPVCVWEVPDGEEWTVEQGHPAILELETSGGADLERGTTLGLAYREPNDPLDAWTVVNEFEISPFNTLSAKDQQSDENAQRRRIKFDPERVPQGRINLEDTDELALIVDSGDVADTSETYFNYPLRVKNE